MRRPLDAARQAWARAKHRRVLAALAGPKLLDAFARLHPEAFFIEIGANDGAKHDHLRPLILSSSWRGIMVEPVPYVFGRLQANYAALADRVTLENVAIAERDGTLPFYHLAEAEPGAPVPEWYDTLGSFSRETILGHVRHAPDIAERLIETEVPCLTFESLCRRNGVQQIDLLLLDTEGYDWEILRHVDLDARRPRLVVYEHYHLRGADRAACRRQLEASGYACVEEGFDTFCVDARRDDELTRVFRGLSPGVPGVSAEDEGR